MGLTDFTSKVLVEYKADISDHKAKVRELTGEQKVLAEQELAAAVARNKQHDDWISGLSKVNLAIDAIKFAFAAVEDYGNRLDLEAASAGVSLDNLSDAAMGLKTNMELLKYAAIFNTSAFKMTQEQMFLVVRAMYNLEERGRSATEVWDAMQQLLTKGAVKSLEGLIGPIDKTGLAMDQAGDRLTSYAQKGELVKRVMDELARVNKEAGPAQLDAADKVQAGTVRLQNAWDGLKQSTGELVSSLTPLIEAFAELAKFADIGVKGIVTQFKDFGTNLAMTWDWMAGDGKWGVNEAERQEDIKKHIDDTPWGVFDFRMQVLAALRRKQWADAHRSSEIEMPAMDVSRARRSGGRDDGPAFSLTFDRDISGKELSDREAKRISDMLSAQSDEIRGGFLRGGFDVSSLDAEIERSTRGSRYADFNTRTGNAKMERVFGKLSDIDLYKSAFDGLTGAVSSSLKAWVDGSESAGKAFKKFIATSIESVGLQMAVEALKEGAYALGSLAIGDVAHAAEHGASAAKFAAGSAVALGIAKSMGGSGSAPGGGGGAGGGFSASGPNAYQRPNAGAVIVYGDPFAMDSPRNRQQQAQKIVNLALGGASGVRNN